MGSLQVVVGAQFGSEAKGAVCGHLLRRWMQRPAKDDASPMVGVRVGGPNAGHTVWSYHPDGSPDFEYKLRCVPVAAVINPDATIALAAGSEVNLDVLNDEMALLDRNGLLAGRKILVDRSATLLTDDHIAEEQATAITARLGSTAKGIGAARADRVWRTATTMGEAWQDQKQQPHPAWDHIDIVDDVSAVIRDAMSWRDGLVQIEGVQGYGLGVHTSNYPFTTSSDCRAIDFLAMAGVSPWEYEPEDLVVWLVARTSPIRVAGNSGPLKDETDWQALGLPEERTTVTNKVRRVGQWDPDLVRAAIAANGGSETSRNDGSVRLAITMLDQIFPEDAGEIKQSELTWEAAEWLIERETELGLRVTLVTTSPHTGVWSSYFG